MRSTPTQMFCCILTYFPMFFCPFDHLMVYTIIMWHHVLVFGKFRLFFWSLCGFFLLSLCVCCKLTFVSCTCQCFFCQFRCGYSQNGNHPLERFSQIWL
jgi:hypothetical protein